MKIGKVLICAVVITLVDALIGMLACGKVFSWVYSIDPTHVWKVFGKPPGFLFFAGSFIFNIILVVIYALIIKGIPGKNKFAKGFFFGLFVWAVGAFPGMFNMYVFINIANTVILYWTMKSLLQSLLRGWIIAYLYGEVEECRSLR